MFIHMPTGGLSRRRVKNKDIHYRMFDSSDGEIRSSIFYEIKVPFKGAESIIGQYEVYLFSQFDY